jgi:hypothetical protein
VAAALFSKAVGNPHPSLTFNTLSGPLTAINRTKEGGLVELNFPMNRPVVVRPSDKDPALYDTCYELATSVLRLAGAGASVEIDTLAYNATTKKLIVQVSATAGHATGKGGGEGGGAAAGSNRRAEAAWRDLEALAALGVPAGEQVLAAHGGSVVTGISIIVAGTGGGMPGDDDDSSGRGGGGSGGYDFASRYFSPWNGIPEDPVNGSSHTLLAPYWHYHVLGLDDGNEPAPAPAPAPTADADMAATANGSAGNAAGDPPPLAAASGVAARRLWARQASPRGGDLVLGCDFGGKRVTMAGPACVDIEGTVLVPSAQPTA